MRRPTPRSAARPSRHGRHATATLLACLAVVAAGLTTPPASASLTVPVYCSYNDEETVLSTDGLTYEVQGSCGNLRVTADDATVHMNSAVRLVVQGRGNVVDAGPLQALGVRGRNQQVSASSVHDMGITSPGSTVRVSGLLEDARGTTSRTTVRADRLHHVRLRGDDNLVRARYGYSARFRGNDNAVGMRRLQDLVLSGRDNRARVWRGETTVRVRGGGNQVRVHRRG